MPGSLSGTLPSTTLARSERLFQEEAHRIAVRTDRLFARLLIAQWVFGILLALVITPRAWEGTASRPHLHLLAAVLLGAIITALPILLVVKRPGEPVTRHLISVAQMLFSALLIHLTGGRIETHFHVFGSLAFVAFYRDWKVLMSASVVVAADHYLRGVFWPQSVYGVSVYDPWRWIEHTGWVVFEDFFLVIACRQAVAEMKRLSVRQAEVESAYELMELRVQERTAELAAANAGLSREVEERRQAQDALRVSEERYRLLFDTNPEPMWVYDLESLGFMAVNATAIERYGYSRDEFLKMTIKDIRPPEDVGRLLAEGLSTSGRTTAQEWRHLRKDGSILEVRISADDFVLEGRPARLVMATDITDQRRVENHLRQSQKLEAIGGLAGGIAHDFNNLLTVMMGQGQLLHRMVASNPAQRERVEEIMAAGQRASALTRQLLAFSRRQVLAPVVMDVNELVREAMALASRLIGEDVQVKLDLAGRPLKLKADPGQIEQIVLNLVVNARDAMPSGGTLCIRTDEAIVDATYASQHPGADMGSYVRLAISDTGVGMDKAIQARIFEPFFTTKEVGKGTGLGLATVYGIVKQSGGFVSVYSEPGHGTTFMLHFPRVEGVAQVRLGTDLSAPLPTGQETILVVEDEEKVRALVRDILVNQGYTVLEAAGGEEALLFSRQYSASIDLILSDVIMPGMSGRDFSERIKAVRPNAAILFMSGYTDDAILRHGIIAEEFSFIQKPFSADGLLTKVRGVLGDRRAA